MTSTPSSATDAGRPTKQSNTHFNARARLRRMRGMLLLLFTRLRMRAGLKLRPEATLARACLQFCTPLPRSRRQGRRLVPGVAVRHDITAAGERIATYRWSRDNPAGYVLLVHGWSSANDCFSAWIDPLLDARFAVVAFDQPAHGGSTGTQADLPRFVSAVEAVIAHYGTPKAMVGHSLGAAAVAATLAGQAEAECAVLVSPAADLGHAITRYTRALRLPDAFAERMSAAFEASTVPIAALRAEALAPKLQARGLIVHDSTDKEVPFSEGERYARHWRGARMLATRGLGHRRVLSDAGVIAEAVGFIAGTPRN